MKDTAQAIVFGPIILACGIYLIGWAIGQFRDSGFEWFQLLAGFVGLVCILGGGLMSAAGVVGLINWINIA